jgi:hypothetical protein
VGRHRVGRRRRSGDGQDVKRRNSRPLRTIGSLSSCRSLLEAGVVDRLRVVVFPVITGATGRDRIFDGYPDIALDLVDSRTFDGRLQLLEYVPTVLAGPPGTGDWACPGDLVSDRVACPGRLRPVGSRPGWSRRARAARRCVVLNGARCCAAARQRVRSRVCKRRTRGRLVHGGTARAARACHGAL